VAVLKLKKWDSAQYLKTEEDMALYLDACLQEAGDDAAFIAKALGHIARAKGMSQLSRGEARVASQTNGRRNTRMTTVLVTGGAGYIGSHTVLALLQAGWHVVEIGRAHV
jgi:DNA-binding phage protein